MLEELVHNENLNLLYTKLDEVRGRIFKCLIPTFAVFCVCMAYPAYIMRFLQQPLVEVLPRGKAALHFTNPIDVLLVYIHISAATAFLVTIPIWAFQLWRFLRHILGDRERHYTLPFVFASTVLFFMGCAFSFYAMLPAGLTYLLGLGKEVATPMITMPDYVSLVIILLIVCGFVFEIPIIMAILTMLQIIQVSTLVKHRKVTIVGILVIAAIVSPSNDPISMLLLAFPMYVLYEAGILVMKSIEKGRHSGASLAK